MNEEQKPAALADGAKSKSIGLPTNNRRLKPKDESTDEGPALFSKKKDSPELRNAVLNVGSLDASSRNTVFLQGAKAFSLLQHRDEDTAPVNDTLSVEAADQLDLSTNSDLEIRFLFELAYSTLKYQELFTDLLNHCRFYTQFPELEPHHCLVMIILNDLINNSMDEDNRAGSDVTDPLIIKVKLAIYSCQTKIGARLARHRIRANALTVDSLLPEQVRFKDRISTQMKAYLWVNQLKTSIDAVINHFSADGFMQVEPGQVKQGNVFAIDHHCYDVIVLPPGHTSYLLQSPLYKEGKIILQDKSSCIAPHSITPLIKDDYDVMHVNVGSGLMTAHISSLLANLKCRIWGLTNDNSPQKLRSLQKRMEELDAKNVKLLQEPFLRISSDDSRFKSVKVILLTANCSKSALNNPVDFVVNEGEDMAVLKRLSRGGATPNQLQLLYSEEVSYLKQALQFPSVHAVIYLTRSVDQLENEVVVSNVVEYVNTIQQPSKPPFGIVPPVLQFNADEIENNIGLLGKYIKFDPSDGMNGCFLAIIARELECKRTSLHPMSGQHFSTKTGVRKSNGSKKHYRNSVKNRDSCGGSTWLSTSLGGSILENPKPPCIQRTEKDGEIKDRENGENQTTKSVSYRQSTLKVKTKPQSLTIPRQGRLHSTTIKQATGHRNIFLSEHKKIINHPKPFR